MREIPNHVMDLIWRAVEEAVLAGVTVKDFREESARCWQQAIRDKLKEAINEWNK